MRRWLQVLLLIAAALMGLAALRSAWQGDHSKATYFLMLAALNLWAADPRPTIVIDYGATR